MPANGFSIGRDVFLDIVTPTGIFRPSIRTGFSSKQETTALEVRAMDGRVLFDELPAGWSGSFEFERADPLIDAFFAQREADYFNGVPSPQISITETITEISGATSQFRYTGVALKYDDAGSKSGDKSVKQKVMFKASRRIRIS